MKRTAIKVIVLALSALFILSGCNNITEESDNMSNESITGTSEVSAEESIPEPKLPFEKFTRETIQADALESKCIPHPTGDFIQPWLCQSWNETTWDVHMKVLKKAGFEFMILQFTSSREDGKYTEFYYPSAYAKDKEMSTADCKTYNIVEQMLKAAKKNGMKVVLGVGGCSDWWHSPFTDFAWCQTQADNTNLLLKEIYDLYKADYPDTLSGWYWAWEMYGCRKNYEENWAKMININLDYMTTLDPSMPCMFSTYYSTYENVSVSRFQECWDNLFSATHFRKGDIWAPMDGFGSIGSLPYRIKEDLALCYVKALEKNENISLWFNIENFNEGGGTCDLNRYVDQMEICSKYCDGLITFSYSHYYFPGQVSREYNTDYVKYLRWLEWKYGTTIVIE